MIMLTSRLLSALPPDRRAATAADVQFHPALDVPRLARYEASLAWPISQQPISQQPIPEPVPEPEPPSMDPADGAERADTFEEFVALSVRDDVPGAPRIRTVKFLMTGIDGDAPRLYLMQTHRFAYHYDFAIEALGLAMSLEAFNAATYFRDQRQFLAGTVLHHESYTAADGTTGLFAIEFWPTPRFHSRGAGSRTTPPARPRRPSSTTTPPRWPPPRSARS
jgi:hypothetical protein